MNLAQPRVNLAERTSVEKMSIPHWPVGKSVVHCSNWWLKGEPFSLWPVAPSRLVVLSALRCQIEPNMKNKPESSTCLWLLPSACFQVPALLQWWIVIWKSKHITPDPKLFWSCAFFFFTTIEKSNLGFCFVVFDKRVFYTDLCRNPNRKKNKLLKKNLKKPL